jgi:GxxExxY protein
VFGLTLARSRLSEVRTHRLLTYGRSFFTPKAAKGRQRPPKAKKKPFRDADDNWDMNDDEMRLRESLGMGMREPGKHADDCAHRTIGAAIEVHKMLGPGFPEELYEAALVAEFEIRGIAYKRQVPIVVMYKSRPIGTFKLDFLVEDVLVVELKSSSAIAPVHISQTIAYLKATDLDLGLVINFNLRSLRDNGIRRVVRSF